MRENQIPYCYMSSPFFTFPFAFPCRPVHTQNACVTVASTLSNGLEKAVCADTYTLLERGAVLLAE
jgi:hypothetical protein